MRLHDAQVFLSVAIGGLLAVSSRRSARRRSRGPAGLTAGWAFPLKKLAGSTAARAVYSESAGGRHGQRARRCCLHLAEAGQDDSDEASETRLLLPGMVACLGRQTPL